MTLASRPPGQAIGHTRPDSTGARDDARLSARIREKVLARLDPQLDISNPTIVRRTIEAMFPKVVEEENAAMSRTERMLLLEQVLKYS